MENKSPSLKHYPKVAILILNWNGWEDTNECLESIFQITYPNYDAIVIDNGSTNESVKKIKEYAQGKIKVTPKYIKYNIKNKPLKLLEYTRKSALAIKNTDLNKTEKEILSLPPNKRLVLIKNEENYGFAKGNNIGMKYALNALNPDYILFLNNDTVVDRDFLTKMVNAGETDKRVGIIGPKIPYYDNPDRNWFCRGIVNWFSINIAYHAEKCVGNSISNDYITGCAALIKSNVIKKIGYLDENLFLYFEDVDYCLRAKNVGFELLVIPAAIVYHKVSATSYTFIKSTAQYYFSRNRIWFVKKYCPKKYLRYSMTFLYLRLFLALGFFTLLRDGSTVKAIIKAYKGEIY